MKNIDPRGPAASRGTRCRAVRCAVLCAALAMVLPLWPLSAHGAEPAAATPQQANWPESDTVLDLMRAEARVTAAQRLGRAQDWLAPPAAQPQGRPGAPYGPGGAAEQDRVDLVAIYGVGLALHADVSVNGAVWRYRQGRHWPIGASGQAGEPRYALVAIDLPCVRLRRDDAVRTACLHTEARHD